MSYAYINRDYMKNKPKFWLCLPYPRRTGMRKLTEIYNVNVKFILGRVHELTFDIPTKVERDHQLVDNPLIELFEGYYQVKMEWNGQTEYFVYVKGTSKLDDSGKSLSYQLYSVPYLIGKKAIPIYDEVSKNLPYYINDFLLDTNWKVGHIDPEFINTYRAYSISQSNALQCLYEICEKFNAVMLFDSVNQTIDFLKPDDKKLGINKGMVFKDGVTIESLGQEIDFNSIITRLYVYGSDGLTFNEVNATGTNYLEDMTWFMHPFEYNYIGGTSTYDKLNKNNYIPTRSSKWMTDELCISYTVYKILLQSLEGVFANLIAQKTNKEDEIIQTQSTLALIEMQLNQAENDLWVINKTYGDKAPLEPLWTDAITRITIYEDSKNTFTNKINQLKQELSDIQDDIEEYHRAIYLNANFSDSELVELNEFIHSGYYTNDAITEANDLLKDSIKAFKEVNHPPVTLTLNIVNFLNDVKFEKIHNRISLGDTVKIKSDDLDIYLSLKIIEINYNLENDNINLTVSNEKDLRDDMAKLVDKIYSSSHSSRVVETNKGNWDKGGIALNEVNTILNNAWDTTKNAVIGGYENTTILDKYGLKSRDSLNNDTYLFINNGVFGITTDNMSSIEVAIDKTGVHADKIVGNLILGNDLRLSSDTGVLEADGDTITIKDQNGNVKVELGKYINPSNGNATYGLNITGGAFNIRTSTNSNEGLQIDSKGMRVYDSSGNITFSTDDPDNVVIGGNTTIDTNNNIKIGNTINFNTSSHAIDVSYGSMDFISNGNNFNFYGGDLYVNGRKVMLEP